MPVATSQDSQELSVPRTDIQYIQHVVQEDEEMLKTFQDLFPDELLNPELSSLDAFGLDFTLLPPAAHGSQAAASSFTPGGSQA